MSRWSLVCWWRVLNFKWKKVYIYFFYGFDCNFDYLILVDHGLRISSYKTIPNQFSKFRCRPAVKISGFHPGDPGSIPGNGIIFLWVLTSFIKIVGHGPWYPSSMDLSTSNSLGLESSLPALPTLNEPALWVVAHPLGGPSLCHFSILFLGLLLLFVRNLVKRVIKSLILKI